MKKICFVIALILTVSLLTVSFSEQGLDNELLGTWYLEQVFINGEMINAGDLGSITTIEFGEDGTVVIDQKDGVYKTNWQLANGKIIVDDLEIQIVDERLEMPLNGMMMFFSRNKPISLIPKMIKADSEIPFCGYWKVTKISSKGVTVPAGLSLNGMDFNMSMSIDLGRALVHMHMNIGRTIDFDLELTTDYTDNGLALKVNDSQLAKALSFSLLRLTEDGGIVTTLLFEDLDVHERVTVCKMGLCE